MKTDTHSAVTLALTLSARAPSDRPIHFIADDCLALRTLAKRATSIATAYCNGWIDSDKYDRRAASVAKKADVLLLPYGLRSTVTGDPRGHCLHLLAVDGAHVMRGDSWGGDESGYGL